MLTILVILAILLQVTIALGMYFRRNGGRTNLIFMFLMITIASWALSDYVAISIHQNSSTIYAIRTVLTLVVLQNSLFYLFTKAFPGKGLSRLNSRARIILAFSLVVAILTQLPWVFSSVSIKNGTANPNPGPAIPLFMIQALVSIGLGFRELLRKRRQSLGQVRGQLNIILGAMAVLLIVVPITNFVLTLALHTTLFVKFAPFYTLFFGGLITYAIVAQRLFDIRAAVARSITYVMLIGTISLVYGILLFGLLDTLLSSASDQHLRQWVYIILIVPLALSFQKIKQFFDQFTNHLFYKDRYDTQEVLDRLGNIVVSEIDLYKILGSTRNVLNSALKSNFVEFILFRHDRPYFEAHTTKLISPTELELSAHIIEQRSDLLITDELMESNRLRKYLLDSNAGLSLRLKAREQTVGYIIIGNKRNGDIYSRQDKQLLLIVANQLAVAIQNALRFEEIQNFNLTLQAKVDQATTNLRRANDKLKTMDETKDDFISMASHQLRTPLTSVKGYLSMTLEGDAGKLNQRQREMLQQAFTSSQRMVYLIADLLNVSRLKTGKFVIEAAPTNLAAVVEQELDQLKETAKAKNLTLKYEQPKDFPSLMLDETKIRQVIMNFADNAIYYTPPGGVIEVRLSQTSTNVELLIVDNGIGVPKAEQHHLFTKFYRAGNARKARPDGTGLGLFMAKKVVVAQGGSIIFDSQEGKGSTFGFSFNKARLAVPDQAA